MRERRPKYHFNLKQIKNFRWAESSRVVGPDCMGVRVSGVDLSGLHEILASALEPVLRDISATGAPQPTIRVADWQYDEADNPTAMLWSTDGSGAGVSVYRGDSAAVRIARAAEHVQEWVIEELQGSRRTNWPVCPRHPNTHPLAPVEQSGAAVWLCPADHVVLVAVGSLS